ncbi:MAG: hypothetical protein CME33_14000 [Gimesia sp.]|uniref:DUF7691 family protein n=1 Tax=Gimesia sp. TaxID=2024833 RepID=UPI000C5D4797|nr:hypothetical protein [Gimesia sp.]MAX37666.1 hypothetical protein [Gimesia sp.]|tara:strand:+ start:573 stop:1109 length:537 start_codon:yes stop_codon:yes gene_type:complete
MSYSLQLYLTNIASIEAVIDSKDQTKLTEIIEYDFSEDNSDGHEEFNLTVSEETKPALECLVMGTQDSELDPADYGYALELIVASMGERLETALFKETRYSYLEQVQYVLPLVERPMPFKLPEWEGYPSVGYMTNQECKEFEGNLNHPEPIVRAGRDEIFDWIAAAANENADLIGFWY